MEDENEDEDEDARAPPRKIAAAPVVLPVSVIDCFDALNTLMS